MSTIRVSNIQDTAGGNNSTPAAIANGIAKAWVNFNGTGTVAVRASYNVSSITDNGVGDYTVNFTTALADKNYSAAITGQRNDGTGVNFTGFTTIKGTTTDNSLSASQATFGTTNAGGTALDYFIVCVAIFR